MDVTRRIKSRAARVLNHLKNYRDMTGADAEIPEDIQDILLQQNEVYIGMYENFPGNIEESILVTNLGLHIHHQNHWKFIGFDQIRQASLPDKKDATHIMIKTLSNEVIEIPIIGKDGVFKDIFGFWRFLDRVVQKDITGVGWT